MSAPSAAAARSSAIRPVVVLHVHACPPPVVPHLEWAVAGALGVPVRMAWAPQPAQPGAVRAEVAWRAPAGTATRVASALRSYDVLRYEVTEEPSPGADGVRCSFTPELGLFVGSTSANGDVVVGEDRLRAAVLAARTGGPLEQALARLLGEAWDAELEPYRRGAEGAPVTWLHRPA